MESMRALPLSGPLDSEVDDVALVEAARSDPAVFGRIYHRYQTRIYRYLLLRARSPEDAGDLAQQVFLQALEALPGYRQQGTPLAAWLFRIARNMAIDYRRRKRHVLPLDLVPEPCFSSSKDDPVRAVLQWEMLAMLQTLLAQLDRKKRDLLALRFACGLTAREIALVVGASEAAIKKQLSRTLQTLKEQYRHDQG